MIMTLYIYCIIKTSTNSLEVPNIIGLAKEIPTENPVERPQIS